MKLSLDIRREIEYDWVQDHGEETINQFENWADEAEKLEDVVGRLQTDIGRVVIAIELGLTDKPALERLQKHLRTALDETGYLKE